MRLAVTALLALCFLNGCASGPAREELPHELVLKVTPVDAKVGPPQFHIEARFLNGEKVIQSPSCYTLGGQDATIFVGEMASSLEAGPGGSDFLERRKVYDGFALKLCVKPSAERTTLSTRATVVREGWIVRGVSDERLLEPGCEVRLTMQGSDLR